MWEVIKCKVTSAAHYMFVAYNEQKKSNSDKAKVNILTNQDLKKKIFTAAIWNGHHQQLAIIFVVH